MSGEMHMRRRRDVRMRYSAAYPAGAERCHDFSNVGDVTGSATRKWRCVMTEEKAMAIAEVSDL